VTFEELTRYVFGAIFLIAIIVAQFRRAAKSMRPPADPAAVQQRAAAIQAELARRGLVPSPAPPPVAPQQRSVSTPQQPVHRRSHQPPAPAIGRTSTLDAPAQPVMTTLLLNPGTGTVEGAGRSSTRRMLGEAFEDPRHARNAVILAEVLGPPVALR